ncbi:hypothetical protein Gste01_03025 [Geobacillus stearothermophilus ATCC 7953]
MNINAYITLLDTEPVKILLKRASDVVLYVS